MPSDVIIVGAGLAGAAAACSLAKRGVRVAVFEARDRVGGRMLNHTFSDGTIVELGGQWIGPSQLRVRRALCAEHRIALRPRSPVVERRWFRDGALHRDGPTSLEDRPAHEHAVARIAADAVLLKAGKTEDEQGRDIASISFADYLVRIGAPLSACDLLSAWWTVSGNGDKGRVPASELLASSAYSGGLTEGMADVWVETLVGGVTALAERMIAASQAGLVLAAPVRAISLSEKAVTITAEGGRSFSARAALVATGLNPLRDIDFDPPLAPEKSQAAATGHGGRAVKVWAKVKGVPVGVLATGGGTGIEWMFAERATEDGATLLVGFGVAGSDWTPDLPRDLEVALARFFPEAELLAWDWHDWNGDPFARGTWVAATVAAPEAVAATTWVRRGALAFASADFAPDQAGWFEGAVASGEAAAQEILDFLGRN